MEPPLLRVQEAAGLLRVSKWTIYRWIDEGRLRASKIGRGSLRVFRASVTTLVEENRLEQPGVNASLRGTLVHLPTARARKKQ